MELFLKVDYAFLETVRLSSAGFSLFMHCGLFCWIILKQQIYGRSWPFLLFDFGIIFQGGLCSGRNYTLQEGTTVQHAG